MIKKSMVLLLLLLVSWSAPCRAETLYVSVAASMTDAFKEIIRVFAQDSPATTIRPNFASSGGLAKQIAQGAPTDLYVPANPQWMEYLLAKQRLAVATVRPFAANRLVFIGPPASKVATLAQLSSLGRIAVGNPANVPAGHYAKQAMEAAGLYASLRQQRKLVLAKDVRQALLYAERGEVAGAFVYRTDALLASKSKILFEVPAGLHEPISYPLALTSSGQKKASARRLYQFIVGPQGQAILQRYGFVVGPVAEGS